HTRIMQTIGDFQLSSVTVYEADGFKIVMARGGDGLWRFDRDTTERIPAMNRAALARFRSAQAERANLKDEFTDPSATLRRFLLEDGKEAWLFNKKTVRNIQAMYEHAKDLPSDPRFVRLGVDLPPLKSGECLGKGRPANVPADLGSPRALLQGFSRVMDAGE